MITREFLEQEELMMTWYQACAKSSVLAKLGWPDLEKVASRVCLPQSMWHPPAQSH